MAICLINALASAVGTPVLKFSQPPGGAPESCLTRQSRAGSLDGLTACN